MPEREYEHRVVAHYDPERVKGFPAEGTSTQVTTDPARAGEEFRAIRRQLRDWGGHAELQRRAVGPWETVERAELPPRAAADPAG